MCAIVFVQKRYAACVLSNLINEHVENSKKKVKSDFVTGHGSQMWASTKTGMNFKKQKEKLKEFRSGSFNVLVGTSVIEEGVDIPQCNLVVMFDFPQDYRAYIQSRGRGRAKDAKYVMLVESSELEEKKQNLEVSLEYNL
jgi:endoribonuclease Dicer